MRLHQRLSLPDRSPSVSRPRELPSHREGDERLHAFPCEVAGRTQVDDACEHHGESCHTQGMATSANGPGKVWGRMATSYAAGEEAVKHCAYRCTWEASAACKGDDDRGDDA